MKTIQQIIPKINAQIEAQAQPTKALPINTKDWADWLKLDLHDAEVEKLVKACAEFGTAFKAKQYPRWLSLLGNSGTGKTHAARKLWKFIEPKMAFDPEGWIPKEIYWPAMVCELRAGNHYELYRDMWKWPVLFLDDIGAERDTSGFASEQLNTLLGCREGKWTIITSNLYLDQLAKIDPRMSDRMIRQPNIFCEIKTKSHALRTLCK